MTRLDCPAPAATPCRATGPGRDHEERQLALAGHAQRHAEQAKRELHEAERVGQPRDRAVAVQGREDRVHQDVDLRGRETERRGRHQAHHALALHPIASHFFRFWLWLTTGMVTKEWVAIHRKHHAKCETVEDPHSPQTRGLKTVLWSGAELYIAVGMLPGATHPDTGRYIIIGGHYDHLGWGQDGTLYKGDVPMIHHGADDNASGTAGVLELAQYYAAHHPNHTMLFMGFAAEEMGLLGSAYWAAHPTRPLERAMAMINFDMIGRLADSTRKLNVQGTGTSPAWDAWVKDANADSTFDIAMIPDGQGSSDQATFYMVNGGVHGDMQNVRDKGLQPVHVPQYWQDSPMLPPPMRHDAGHGGSAIFISAEFINALLEDREPEIDIYESLAMTVPGIVAHASSFKDGEQLPVPQFDRKS